MLDTNVNDSQTISNAQAASLRTYSTYMDSYKMLDTGQYSGQECPDCGERTASVNVTPYSSVYFCHRASCGARGATFGMNQGGIPRMPVKPPELIPTAVAVYAREWYKLTCHFPWIAGEEHSYRNVMSTVDRSQLLLPVFALDNVQRGVMERSFPGISPKHVKLWVMSRPFVAASWYGLNSGGDYLFVVEDQFSAMRLASANRTAVSLLGTEADPDKCREIRAGAGKRQIVVALDKDATSKAYKLAPLLGAAIVWQLPGNDIKDMSEDDFHEQLAQFK